MIDVIKLGLNAQGYIVEANGGRFEEEDDVSFPEREDIDDKADRLYDEYKVRYLLPNVDEEINS